MKCSFVPLLGALLGATALPAFASNAFWTDGQAADVVIGQTDFVSGDAGDTSAKVESPSDVAVDPTTGKLFVADPPNNRVLRFGSYAAFFNGAFAEAVIGQPDFGTTIGDTSQTKLNNPSSVFVDSAGRLWVGDVDNFRIVRFDNASTIASGAPASAVLGQVDFDTNTFPSTVNAASISFPIDLVVSENGALYVADVSFHRVVRFDSAAAKNGVVNADAFFFQANQDDTSPDLAQNRVNFPAALAVSSDDRLWVADTNNVRVLRVDNASTKTNGAGANAVIGFDNFDDGTIGSQTGDNLFSCLGLAFHELTNTLYIVDSTRDRIVVVEDGRLTNGPLTIAAVLGQDSIGGSGSGLSQTKLNSPRQISLDPAGRIWTVDTQNNRVIRYSPNGAATGIQPDLLIGPKANRLKGDGLYSESGAGQQSNLRITGRKASRLIVLQQNDGYTSHATFLGGTKRNRNMNVKYIGPGGNVTAAMVSGSLSTGTQAGGGSTQITAQFKPRGNSQRKSARFTAIITARDPNSSAMDAVRSRVRAKAK
ncbi:MAG: NHL repeat-containing protein [Verrucomicrobiota bacterium]